MKYLLDLTNAEKPKFWKPGDPLLIPCETGKHHLAYDILMDELPKEFAERMDECSMREIPPESIRRNGDLIEKRPVGFHESDLVYYGAVLIETGSVAKD